MKKANLTEKKESEPGRCRQSYFSHSQTQTTSKSTFSSRACEHFLFPSKKTTIVCKRHDGYVCNMCNIGLLVGPALREKKASGAVQYIMASFMFGLPRYMLILFLLTMP